MIRVLHLINSLEVGGAEASLLQLTERMDRLRFRNVVTSLTDGATLVPGFKAAGIPVYTLGLRSVWRSPASLFRLRQIIRKERPQVLQTWLHFSDFLGLIAGTVTKVPKIFWNLRCEDMGDDYYRGLTGLMIRVLVKYSGKVTGVIANSEAGRRHHEKLGYKPNRWHLICNGIDPKRFFPEPSAGPCLRTELQLDDETKIVGLVARYDSIKDHVTFLAAAKRINSSHPNVHFALVGKDVTPENHSLRRTIEAYGLSHQIHLLGHRVDIQRVTAGFDLATCSSRAEGFPNAIGEAMACGIPCVSTDAGDAQRIIGNTGFVVPPNDPDAFADACRKLLGLTDHARREMGRSARARICREFSVERSVECYEALYEEAYNSIGSTDVAV